MPPCHRSSCPSSVPLRAHPSPSQPKFFSQARAFLRRLLPGYPSSPATPIAWAVLCCVVPCLAICPRLPSQNYHYNYNIKSTYGHNIFGISMLTLLFFFKQASTRAAPTTYHSTPIPFDWVAGAGGTYPTAPSLSDSFRLSHAYSHPLRRSCACRLFDLDLPPCEIYSRAGATPPQPPAPLVRPLSVLLSRN